MNSFIRFFLFLIVLISKGNLSVDWFLANIELNNFDFFNGFIERIDKSDIVWRLIIESLDIDTVLVQSKDNFYYLNHDLYGNENSKGSIFLDYRNSNDLDRKLLIYGHNSKDKDTVFNKLENYLSLDFLNSYNKEIRLITMNKESIYEVSNVLIMESDSFGHMKLVYDDSSWKEYIDFINNNSFYSVGLNYLDNILVLQTCNYDPDNTFLLIIAKKKEEVFY